MSVFDSKFNVPEYVASADPSALDSTKAGAVVVEGLRIDNKAAAWVAMSELLKKASGSFSHLAEQRINQACELFGITAADFVEKTASVSDTIYVEDGVNSAAFSVVDNESLNKAASSLIAERKNIPYLFARECAEALRKVAHDKGLEFDTDNLVAMKKMAGQYHVDYEASKKLLDSTIVAAENSGMSKYASELRRVASIFTEECPEQLAALVVEAIDQTKKAMPLNKYASTVSEFPEQIVYCSNKDLLAKKASETVDIIDCGSISVGKLAGSVDSISKWASDCGYTVQYGSKPEEVATVINSMPGLLRKEFIEVFG